MDHSLYQLWIEKEGNNLYLCKIIFKQNRQSEVIIISRKQQMLKQQDAL